MKLFISNTKFLWLLLFTVFISFSSSLFVVTASEGKVLSLLPSEEGGYPARPISPTPAYFKMKESNEKAAEAYINFLDGTGSTAPFAPPPSQMPRPITPVPVNGGPDLNPGDLTLVDTGMTYSVETVNNVRNCLGNYEVYKKVEAQTGVPWKVLAGIHFIEGGCSAQKSCVSGRLLGDNEPDLRGNCSQNSAPGKPKPLPGGGCGFTTLEDSCIYGANHLKGKLVETRPLTFTQLDQLAKALGRYNGTGNANCGKVQTIMPYCPVPYEGYDHIYPFKGYDSIHETMYVVYCADYTPCSPPKVWTRLGVLAIMQILTKLGY